MFIPAFLPRGLTRGGHSGTSGRDEVGYSLCVPPLERDHTDHTAGSSADCRRAPRHGSSAEFESCREHVDRVVNDDARRPIGRVRNKEANE